MAKSEPKEPKEPSLLTSVRAIKLALFEPILGSAPGNPELYREYIAGKAPPVPDAETKASKTEEEVATLPPFDVEAQIEKASTVFHRDKQGLFLYDYQLKGFFKEALLTLINVGLCPVSKWTLKKAVDGYVFIAQRRVYLLKPDGSNYDKADSTLSRPLRAETMQGERTTLANSELLPGGTILNFTMGLLLGQGKAKAQSLTGEHIEAALTYGSAKGLGQWRSGSYGRFTWEEGEVDNSVYDLPNFAMFKLARQMQKKNGE